MIYKKQLTITEDKRAKIMAMDENLAIRDAVLLKKGIVVLALTMVGFVLHQYLEFEFV